MSETQRPRAVFDTNVFVAAGFNLRSSSAQLIGLAQEGAVEMVWSDATRRETAFVLGRIPRLDWEKAEPLFRPEGRYEGPLDPDAFDVVGDPDDRKFAALAAASGATLVSSDDHLLDHRGRPELSIATPSEFLRRVRAGEN